MSELPSNSSIKSVLENLSKELSEIITNSTPKFYLNRIKEIEAQCTSIVIDQILNENPDFKWFGDLMINDPKITGEVNRTNFWEIEIMLFLECTKKILVGPKLNDRYFNHLYSNEKGEAIDSKGKVIRYCIKDKKGKVIKYLKPSDVNNDVSYNAIRAKLKDGHKITREKPIVSIEELYTEEESKAHYFELTNRLSKACLALASFFEDKGPEITETKKKSKNKIKYNKDTMKKCYLYFKDKKEIPKYRTMAKALGMGNKTINKYLSKLIEDKKITLQKPD
jgi:hypothetical protein